MCHLSPMSCHFSLYALCRLYSVESILLVLLYHIVLALSIEYNSSEEMDDYNNFLLFIFTYNASILSFVPAKLFLNVFLNDTSPARQPRKG